MIDNLNINEVLAAINPSDLDYQEWVNVGMALKDAGHPVSIWDAWSARDGARYRFGECVKKWETFGRSNNNGTPTVEYYNNGDPVTFEMREIKGLIRNAPTVSPYGDGKAEISEEQRQFDLQVELNSSLQHDMMRLEVKYENLKNERDGLLDNKHQMQMKHRHLSRRNELLEQKLKEITAICQRDITPTVYDNPWVKTADRLQTDNELRDGRVLISGGMDWYSIQGTREILEKYPQYYPYWMAIPPLPEVEG